MFILIEYCYYYSSSVYITRVVFIDPCMNSIHNVWKLHASWSPLPRPVFDIIYFLTTLQCVENKSWIIFTVFLYSHKEIIATCFYLTINFIIRLLWIYPVGVWNLEHWLPVLYTPTCSVTSSLPTESYLHFTDRAYGYTRYSEFTGPHITQITVSFDDVGH